MSRPRGNTFGESFDVKVLDQLLKQFGLHPDDVVTLLRYAPLGLTHLAWRNSVLEDWHAGPESRISDGDMFRTNAATTEVFHANLWPAFAEDFAAADLLDRQALDEYDVDVLEGAFYAADEEVFDPERVLPNGMTLLELGGEEVPLLQEHGARQFEALLEQADEKGVHVVVSWLALRGAVSCPQWWLSPRWPSVVDAFLNRLDDNEDSFWSLGGYPEALPAEFNDRPGIRRTLLTAPYDLSADAAQFCVGPGGLRFIRLEQPLRVG
ncbi:hypothetical protein [Kribbella yunnanensis]|uniref:hypothetical protein n=1 Tax=Kribbella yunnanensis TaxID=190194 RepID=UPI0031DD8D9C